ncbi:MAG: hypothetical protein R6U57_12300 [Anaerolineales bacterium]
MEKKPTFCIYHNDLDGRASAAIVNRKLDNEITFYGMSYGDQTPWSEIEEAERVIIVDFSLPKEDMNKIHEEKELIWIDHHKSALDEFGHHALAWEGARDTTEAACVLTWRYFYPQQEVPQAIVLIGDRDIWRWEEKDTGPFNEGLHRRDTHPENKALWQPLLENDRDLIKDIIQEGELLLESRLEDIKRDVRSYGYPVIFEDCRTLAINQRGNGDLGARIRELGYEVGYCYIDNLIEGELRTFVSLYSDKVDVSQIARKFGGGGHPGAAGFHFKRRETPFPAEAAVQILEEV